MAGTLSEVTDNNFDAEVLESASPVLVDFWAPWCGPCRVVAPVLEEIASERPDLRVVKLNVDDNQQTAARYQVLSIPTLILFKGGSAGQDGDRRLPEEEARAGARAGPRRLRPVRHRQPGRLRPGQGDRELHPVDVRALAGSCRPVPARRGSARARASLRRRSRDRSRRRRSARDRPPATARCGPPPAGRAFLRAFWIAWTISRPCPSRRRSSSSVRSSATACAPSRSTE